MELREGKSFRVEMRNKKKKKEKEEGYKARVKSPQRDPFVYFRFRAR